MHMRLAGGHGEPLSAGKALHLLLTRPGKVKQPAAMEKRWVAAPANRREQDAATWIRRQMRYL
jgi:hypothetical protein